MTVRSYLRTFLFSAGLLKRETKKERIIMKNKTLQICLLAMFCALSAIGAQIHIHGSIALDALPAFLAALLLGGPGGAVVGALGHLLPRVWRVFP
jgi:hypothetical protein